MKKIKKGQNGEVMIESLLAFFPVLFVLFLMISLAFLLYQKTTMQTVVNEIAAKTAQTYRYNSDIKRGTIKNEEVIKGDPYRYTTLFGTNEYEAKAKKNASDYAEDYISMTKLWAKPVDGAVNLELSGDGIGRQHLEIKIEGAYEPPFGGWREMFGFKKAYNYTVQSYAEIDDMHDILSMVMAVKNYTNILMGDTKFINAANPTTDVVQELIGYIRQIARAIGGN